jgi:hypothetical protein
LVVVCPVTLLEGLEFIPMLGEFTENVTNDKPSKGELI